MGKKRKTGAKEDRRAFLAFLTMLLAFLTSVVNMVTGALNYSTARREKSTVIAAEGHAVGTAVVIGLAETVHVTGWANVQLGPATLSATGTVTNPPAQIA
jgi:hypothetical protein